MLSRLFRRLVLEKLAATYGQGLLTLQGSLAQLATPAAFASALRWGSIQRLRHWGPSSRFSSGECSPGTGHHPWPPSGSIRHELEPAAGGHDAASLYRRLSSRKALPLPLEAASPGNNGQAAASNGFFSSKPDANPTDRDGSNPRNASAANGCGCRSSYDPMLPQPRAP
ncbi:MAG: hypothetical protein WBX25_36780 [Rhodomicrobium sp.]